MVFDRCSILVCIQFLYNCKASHYFVDDERGKTVEEGQGEKVVDKLVSLLAHHRHLVVMDNFFPSIELFEELEKKGIYATRLVHSNYNRYLTNYGQKKVHK